MCDGRLGPVWAVIELVGPLAEIIAGAHLLASFVGVMSTLGAAVLGLTPAAGAPTIVTVTTLLTVGRLVLLVPKYILRTSAV